MASQSFTSTERSFSIGELGPVLRRWWWLMLPPIAVAVAAVIFLTDRAIPTYRAEAEVVIRTEESSNLFPLSEATALLRSPSAEAGFLASTEYESQAEAAAGSADRVVIDVGNVNSRVEPSFISFTATGNNPESVAATATAWAETYIDLRHQRDEAELSQTIATLTDTAELLNVERADVLIALEPIDRLLATTDDATEVARLSTQRVALFQSIEPQLTPIDSQLSAINDELAGMRLIQNFLSDETVSARMNRVPTVPTSPVSPSLPRNLAFGIFGALLIGGVAVLLAEARDDRVRSTDQLSSQSGLPYLSAVPLNRRDDGKATLKEHGPLAESFQRLASSIDFARVSGGQKQVLMFTSARASESKTTTVARLGAVLSRQGRRTLVIGADLRRPTLTQRFDAAEGPGLAEYLGGLYSADNCVVPVDGMPDLFLLRAGTVLGDRSPAELLRNPRMGDLIEALREEYDHILIDCPPVLPVVDALEIAKLVDGIVLSAFSTRTKMGDVDQALDLIRRSAHAPVLGYVLTGVRGRSGSYAESYYAPARSTRGMQVPRSHPELIPDVDLVETETVDVTLPAWKGPEKRSARSRVLAAREALDRIEADLGAE